MKNIRKPAVAGYFYPSDKEKLLEAIEWSFTHELGPGTLPKGEPANDRNILAAQVPHAGYIYSGPAAAHVYLALYYDGRPDTIVIMGPNHHGVGPRVSVYSGDAWETPLGLVEVDKEYIKELSKNDPFTLDTQAHAAEHSIEVQLPFLQYIYGNGIKIVPITIWDQSLDSAQEISDILFDVSLELGKDVIFLASSDMSHYDTHERTVEKDREAIVAIESLDEKGLYKVIYEKDITMCGYGPVITAILLTKKVNGRAFTLKYYTSGDITGDKSAVVGYASIIFTKGQGSRFQELEAEKEALPI